MQASDLPRILEKARVKNEHLNITGFLLYDKGSFLQVLEGPEDSVQSVMTSILADDRHGNIKFISNKIVSEREFGDWSMAYAVRDGEQPECDGFLDYAASREEFSIEGNEVTQILAMFQDGLLRQADHRDDGANNHFTVTIASQQSMPTVRHAKFLIDFGRALSLTVPDTQIGVSFGDGSTINFNLNRDMREGELELF